MTADTVLQPPAPARAPKVAAPEARQDQREGSETFGAVAVKTGDTRWSVMTVENGGHHGTEAEVSDWKILE